MVRSNQHRKEQALQALVRLWLRFTQPQWGLSLTLELLRVIEPSGESVAEMEPEIPRDELRRLYRVMVLTRNLDTRGLQLQRQGRIGFYIGCLGQEAAHIGSA